MDQPWACSQCGRSLDRIRRLVAVPGGGHICAECVERRTTHCVACDALLKDREYVEAYGGQRLCLGCLRAHRYPSQAAT